MAYSFKFSDDMVPGRVYRVRVQKWYTWIAGGTSHHGMPDSTDSREKDMKKWARAFSDHPFDLRFHLHEARPQLKTPKVVWVLVLFGEYNTGTSIKCYL